MNPFLIKYCVEWLQEDPAPPGTGLVIVACIFLVGVTRSLSGRAAVLVIFQLNLVIQNILRGIIFEGIMFAPAEALKFIDIGRISNFVMNDISAVTSALNFSHNLIVSFDPCCEILTYTKICPLLMVIYTLILFQRIGWIGIVMPIFLVVIYLQNRFINKITVIKTKEKNIQGDKRGKKINECIEGIKIVKFSAWELIFLESIDNIRKEEVGKNYQLFFFRSLNDAALILFPSILAFLSLWLYSFTHPEPLDLGNTFVVITSFNLILQPTRQFFNSINNILTAVISFKRIELIWKLRKFENTIGLDAVAVGEIVLENYSA